MSQIVRKAGGKDPQPETAPLREGGSQLHVTEGQAVLLTELIRKNKSAVGPGAPSIGSSSGQRPEGAMTLDALVKRAKTR